MLMEEPMRASSKSATSAIEPLLLLYRSEEKGTVSERLITLIGERPFYKSTGKNSQLATTFFPFDGLIYTGSSGWFRKPHDADITTNYFPKPFLGFIRKMEVENEQSVKKDFGFIPYSYSKALPADDFMIRMGNFKYLSVSMLIGGGFWETDTGKKIERFIKDNFGYYLEDLTSQYGETIKTIKETVKVDNEKSVVQHVITSDKADPDKVVKAIHELNSLLINASPQIIKEEKTKVYTTSSVIASVSYLVPSDYTCIIPLVPQKVLKNTNELTKFLKYELEIYDNSKDISKEDKLAHRKNVLDELIDGASKEVLQKAYADPYFRRHRDDPEPRQIINSLFFRVFSKDIIETNSQQRLMARIKELEIKPEIEPVKDRGPSTPSNP
jgi:hypothetical protein